jgi:hypothetical protein
MKSFADYCLAFALAGIGLWLCLHPAALGWILLFLFGACLFAPYLAFPVWFVSKRPPCPPPEASVTPPPPAEPTPPSAPTPAPQPDILTPFVLGFLLGRWFGGGSDDNGS